MQVAQLLREYRFGSAAVDSFVADLEQGLFGGAAAAWRVGGRLEWVAGVRGMHEQYSLLSWLFASRPGQIFRYTMHQPGHCRA